LIWLHVDPNQRRFYQVSLISGQVAQAGKLQVI